MAETSNLVVFGASGHAKVVIRCAEAARKFKVVGLLDDDPAKAGDRILGYEIIGARDLIPELLGRFSPMYVIVAIGDNQVRASIAHWLVSSGAKLATVVHPSAVISPCVSIGVGTVVMPGAVINAEATIGANAIINSNATIEHDCRVGDDSHIGPGSTLCGGACIGRQVLVGAGASILPGIAVGDLAVVGGGAVVLGDVATSKKVFGVVTRAPH